MATGIGLDPISVAKETRNAYIRIRDAPGDCGRLWSIVSNVVDGFVFDEDTAETFN